MLLGDIVRLNGRKSPGKTAIVSEDRTVTFGELRDRMFQVANAMREPRRARRPGRHPGREPARVRRVLLRRARPPAWRSTFLNYRLHPKEWAWILNNAEASVLLVQDKYLEQIEPLSPTSPDGPARRRHRRRRRSETATPDYERRGRRGVGRRAGASRSTRTPPRGCSTRAARPASPRAPCSPTAT